MKDRIVVGIMGIVIVGVIGACCIAGAGLIRDGRYPITVVDHTQAALSRLEQQIAAMQKKIDAMHEIICFEPEPVTAVWIVSSTDALLYDPNDVHTTVDSVAVLEADTNEIGSKVFLYWNVYFTNYEEMNKKVDRELTAFLVSAGRGNIVSIDSDGMLTTVWYWK